MKEIKLTQQGKNKGKFIALVDDEDFEYLNRWRWCADKIDHIFYAIRITVINGKRKKLYMHRVIMNTPDSMDCDHAFHNELDNRKFIEIDGEIKPNLRNCTHQQNIWNHRNFRNGKSKYLGVSYNGKYIRAMIRINGKQTHIGYYPTEEDAAKARDKESIKYFGDFANLNFKIHESTK